jgi:hypothetical protein
MVNIKLMPKILTHPNIPKPLHGISPRTIMGEEWWNQTRHEVYAKYDNHCIACGVSKYDARGHKWIEAHEFWEIDYSTGICEIKSIEPLCHYCHNFIHSGRLHYLLESKQKSEQEVKDILEHGLKILSENKLMCFPGTIELALYLDCETYSVLTYQIPEGHIKWGDWKLIWNGKEYRSKFSSPQEWASFYGNEKKGDQR